MLKEVGRPCDMDNNMFALIKQRMCTDNCKVWACHLESDGKETTLAQLITWINTEMKSRVRAAAPLKNVGQHLRHPVNHVTPQDSHTQNSSSLPKFCIYQTLSHWVNQCPKITSLSFCHANRKSH